MRIFAAALLMLAAGLASADGVVLTWELPTKYTDGTDIELDGDRALLGTRIEWGSCDGESFGEVAGQQLVVVPLTSYLVEGLPVGEHCFRAFAQLVDGEESIPTNIVRKTIEPCVPEPPTALHVVDPIAYQVIGTPNKFALIPVGRAPLGETCDTEQTVNGYFAVPRETINWYGSVRPQVVVAKCG